MSFRIGTVAHRTDTAEETTYYPRCIRRYFNINRCPMKYPLLLLFALVACSAVKDGPGKSFQKQLARMSDTEVNDKYRSICANLEKARAGFSVELKKATTDAAKKSLYARARKLLITTLSDSLFVCWYGTEWDYNGTTTTPRNGSIACGYFVTTLIRDAGFVIPRTKLAQCASQSMINTLCPKKDVKIITNNDEAKVKAHLLSKPDGIFILGLDNHTGFVVKKDSTLRFVHSNYTIIKDGVMSEDFNRSSVIQDNGYFVVGNFLGSDSTIINWINGTEYLLE